MFFAMKIHFTVLSLLALWLQQDAPPINAGDSGMSFVLMLLQTLLMLGFVCGLAYALFRWVLPRLQTTNSSNSMVRIVDRTGLDARKSLFVIEVAGRWLLVASSEAGVQLVSELDAKSAEDAAERVAALRPGFNLAAAADARDAVADRFSRLLNKRK